MTIAELMTKMISYTTEDSAVAFHDINHFLKVWGYARTIGELEGLDEKTQFVLEAGAIVHDIACPYCRRVYGKASGDLQEKEGGWIVRDFLSTTDLDEEVKERLVYLVSHHHTYEGVEGLDYQILLEADFLVNADESSYNKEIIENMFDRVFKTKSGKELLRKMYL